MLGDVVCGLSDAVLTAYPMLGAYAAMMRRLPLGVLEAKGPIDRRAVEAASPEDDPATRLRDLLLVSAMLRGHGRFASAMELVDVGESILHEIDWNDQTRALLPVWYLQAGITAHLSMQESRAESLFAHGWNLRADDRYDGLLRIDIAGGLATIYALRGEHLLAHDWISRSSGSGPADDWISQVTLTGRRTAAVIEAIDHLDETAARTHLRDVRPPTMFEERWPFTLWARVQVGLVFGDAFDLREVLDDTAVAQSLTLAEPGMAVDIMAEMKARVALALGHVAQANEVLKAVPVGRHESLRARAALLAGLAADAESVATDGLGAHPCVRETCELLMVRATARYLSGDLRGTGNDVETVIRAVAPGVLRPFLDVPRRLLLDLIDQVAGVSQIVQTLEAKQLQPVYPTSARSVQLTVRERAIVHSLHSGLTLAEIAKRDFVTIGTVKTQKRLIYRKLDVHSRHELMARVRDRGLLE